MAFEKRFSFQMDSSGQFTSLLAFNDDGQLHVRFGVEGNEGHAKWVFDVEQKSMHFSVVSHQGKQAICIATCLGKALGKPLLECLLDSRSIQDVGNCLNGKAIGAYADAVTCVALCLALI